MGSETKSAAPDLSTDLLPTGTELRGSVLDVLKALLAEFKERDAVLEIFGKLVAENSTMAQRLARIAARFKTSEKISKAQLVLFADALRRGEGEPEPELEGDAALEPDELDTADEHLRTAAGLDDKDAADLAKLRTGSCGVGRAHSGRRSRRPTPCRSSAVHFDRASIDLFIAGPLPSVRR